MKKQKIAKIIAINFMKSIGIMALFFAVGVLSFFLTKLYYRYTVKAERSTAYEHVITVNTGNESSNLIYSYDEKTKKVKAIVLEMFDETTKNLVYLTIPANTQISISSETYEQLMEASHKVPQLAKMSDINEYFSGDVAYEYGILILKEDLKADIGYFTAMNSDVFEKNFQNVGSKKKPKYKPSEELLKKMADCSTEKDMKKLMSNMWEDVISDLTLSQKQHYAKALTQVNHEFIRAYRAYGSSKNKEFTLNAVKNKNLINDVWESEAYTTAQKGKASEDTAAVAHTIQITNGSGITGLAAAYQDKLKQDGWNVQGVGNYVGGIQTSTVIYAQKKRWAKGLLGYFKNARIEKATKLTNGAEIEIVLGTEDKLS